MMADKKGEDHEKFPEETGSDESWYGQEDAVPENAPAFNIPGIVLLLIASFFTIHLVRGLLDTGQDFRVILFGAFIPVRLDPDIAGGLPGGQLAMLYSWVSYSFLHGDFQHILFNSIWLIIFGSAVARRVSARAFILFFVMTSVGGALAHLVMHWNDSTPVIGASAVVSGLTGAATRFMFGNQDSRTMFAEDWVSTNRLLSIPETLKNRSAVFLIVIWTAINYLTGTGIIPLVEGDVSIAWEAHIGGFFTGFLFYSFFENGDKGSGEDNGDERPDLKV